MDTATVETGSRARTRQAILDAAAAVLCRRPAATLGEIAEAAQVGRTTLHRYFPERTDLVAALSLHLLEQLRAALRRARLDEGPGREALLRAGRELFDLGDVQIAMSAGDPEFWRRPEWQEEDETDVQLTAAVVRGHADGTITPTLSASFVTGGLFWSILYGAASWVHDDEGRSRQEALAMAVRALDGALRP